MNGNEQAHPARSVDFLSRLHDGDLDAGERARFEAHRAHCAECRRAALEFEDALSLFRSARSTPPRSDLASRILRKVQTTNRPRSPFPRRFQIDLGWAALLLTALFAILITTPLLVRQGPPAPPPPLPTPPPPPAVAAEAPAAEPPPARRREKPRLSDARPARPPASRDEDAGRAIADSRATEAEAEAAKPPDRPEPAESRRESARAAAAAPQAGSAGGEGDVSSRMAAAVAPLRLTVHEADGFGRAPGLRSETRIALPASERGREYVLLVDSQGTVRSVTPDREVSRALARLRFEAGPRPRRVLVRLE